jgi:hypothetical protein
MIENVSFQVIFIHFYYCFDYSAPPNHPTPMTDVSNSCAHRYYNILKYYHFFLF